VHHLEFVMGMPVLIDVCDPGYAVDEVVEWLHLADSVFSTYRADSEISRLNRGSLPVVSPMVREVLDRCAELFLETRGYFDIAAPYGRFGAGPEPGRGGPGSVDPSGYVKGWAVAAAARMLSGAGASRFHVNAGGDIAVAGNPDGDSCWRIGIQHPRRARGVALVLALRDGAVATSGAYARGGHVVDPFGFGHSDLLSVTVVGPDLARADAFATAAFAMGRDRGAAFCARLDGYAAALICTDNTVLSTPGLERYRA
jgi:thiamine biosynthesis lipoprotein